MIIKQAGTSVTDDQMASAYGRDDMTRGNEQLAWWTSGIAPSERLKCRLYSKLTFSKGIHRNMEMNPMKILGCVIVAAVLSSCAVAPDLMASSDEQGLWLVPVNHTDRYAPNIVVEDAWAGNVRPHGGGGGATCCLAGRKDWSKPVLVKWEWGYEVDPVTKKITIPDEEHSTMVSFPRAPKRLNKSIKEPWSTEDYMADEAYLCVIFRSLDKVEFAYSYSGSGCKQK